MNSYLSENLNLWNEWAEIHIKSDYYDVDGFRRRKCSLKSIELEELGDVMGKSLLHLQCHLGLDSLSWAHRGAQVTGVDFSDKAITFAKSLSEESSIPAKFVRGDISELPGILAGKFDIVFTSYGVLTWLPDLGGWAKVIAHFLNSGGIFYMVEFHPFFMVFDDAEEASSLKVSYPYFETSAPLEVQVQGSYAERNAQVNQPLAFEWAHSMSEILNALISAGLQIEFLHEFDYCADPVIPSIMERGLDGWWRLKGPDADLPLMFSLKASKRQ